MAENQYGNAHSGKSVDSGESEKVIKRYEEYDRPGSLARTIWTIYNPINHYYMVSRERHLVSLIKKHSLDVGAMKILDVGCGNGGTLRDFLRYGAEPSNLHGVDLSRSRIESARGMLPSAVTLSAGDGERLAYPEAHFDAVILHVVLSSVLDDASRRKIASEVSRVLRPGGVVFYYDCFDRSMSSDRFRYVSRGELSGLFPGFSFDLRTTILRYEIGFRVAKFSWLACELLDMARIFNTYYIGLLTKGRR